MAPRFSRLVLAVVIGILVAPAAATAQSALDQYVPSEKPRGTSGFSGGTPAKGDPGFEPAADGSKPAAAAVQVDDGSAGGGDVPGSGYPLTTFAAIAAALVLLALLARVIRPLRKARIPSIRAR